MTPKTRKLIEFTPVKSVDLTKSSSSTKTTDTAVHSCDKNKQQKEQRQQTKKDQGAKALAANQWQAGSMLQTVGANATEKSIEISKLTWIPIFEVTDSTVIIYVKEIFKKRFNVSKRATRI